MRRFSAKVALQKLQNLPSDCSGSEGESDEELEATTNEVHPNSDSSESDYENDKSEDLVNQTSTTPSGDSGENTFVLGLCVASVL